MKPKHGDLILRDGQPSINKAWAAGIHQNCVRQYQDDVVLYGCKQSAWVDVPVADIPDLLATFGKSSTIASPAPPVVPPFRPTPVQAVTPQVSTEVLRIRAAALADIGKAKPRGLWGTVVERTKARIEAERTGKQPTSGAWDRTVEKFQHAEA
ncbi:MAG: hypothetical protein ABIQ70_07055 [Dokdonella sp.]